MPWDIIVKQKDLYIDFEEKKAKEMEKESKKLKSGSNKNSRVKK